MDTAYGWLKFMHILLVIIAVGFNASYGIWLARASREPEHEGWTLRVIQTLDQRFANPAYALLLITGLIMVAIGFPLITDLWIILALFLYVVLLAVGIAGYTPTLRRQIAVLDAEGGASPAYRRLAARSRALGIALAVVVTGIVFLMVMKPTL